MMTLTTVFRGETHVRRTRALLIFGAVGLLFAALTVPKASAATPSAAVYAGYADNFPGRTGGNTPSPWRGDPGVTFSGCQTCASGTNPEGSTAAFDSSAVRVVNNSGSTETINSVVVHFNACTYDIWTHNVSLAPGDQFIVAQTTTTPGPACQPTTGSIDGSDIGPQGQSWEGTHTHCAQNSMIPTVDVTMNGLTATYPDRTQVLNTSGFDKAECTAPGATPTAPVTSEFTVWTPLTAERYTGRAAGLSVKLGSANPVTFGDTGDVDTIFTSSNNQGLVNVAAGPVSAQAVQGATRTGFGTSSAEASVATVAIGSGASQIRATGVQTTSTSTCSGSTGQFTIASLTVGGKGINVTGVPPNTTIPLGPLGSIIINEQAPVAGADHGLIVNALDVTLTGIARVIVSSSRSDIHNC
jgi:hypothetical protein